MDDICLMPLISPVSNWSYIYCLHQGGRFKSPRADLPGRKKGGEKMGLGGKKSRTINKGDNESARK